MGLAIMSYARTVWPVYDSTIRADDVHDAAIIFVCALRHFVRLQTLGVPSSDVAPQFLRDGRAEFCGDARLWVFEEWKYRRGVLERIA